MLATPRSSGSLLVKDGPAWTSRFCTIRGSSFTLHGVKAQSSSKSSSFECVELKSASVVPALSVSSGQQFAFHVISTSSTLMLAAASAEEMEGWIRALKARAAGTALELPEVQVHEEIYTVVVKVLEI